MKLDLAGKAAQKFRALHNTELVTVRLGPIIQWTAIVFQFGGAPLVAFLAYSNVEAKWIWLAIVASIAGATYQQMLRPLVEKRAAAAGLQSAFEAMRTGVLRLLLGYYKSDINEHPDEALHEARSTIVNAVSAAAGKLCGAPEGDPHFVSARADSRRQSRQRTRPADHEVTQTGSLPSIRRWRRAGRLATSGSERRIGVYPTTSREEAGCRAVGYVLRRLFQGSSDALASALTEVASDADRSPVEERPSRSGQAR